ncbi:MAG TPA: hypothetical protein VF278_10295 [Pirellulales bacterium]
MAANKNEKPDDVKEVAEYRVSAVACTLDDPAGGARWNFSDNQGGDAKRWHELKKDGRLTIDPWRRSSSRPAIGKPAAPAPRSN